MAKHRFPAAFGATIRTPAIAALLIATAFLADEAAAADKLVAKGTTLEGKVKAITTAGVEFQPDFAKDSLLVPWDNVDELDTDAKYQVLYGDDQEVIAEIDGFDDGKLEVGDAEIDPKTLVAVTAMTGDEPSFLDRTRASWRYWHGDFGLGVNVQQATTDSLGLLVALNALRSQGPTRLVLGASYRYQTEESPGTQEKRTKDAASGLVRGEYDITKRLYAYGSTDVLYDAVQNLSLRAVPKAGAGFVLWQREPKEGVRDFVSLEAGAGWVYEKYMPQPVAGEEDYFTVALGAAAAVLLPRGAAFDWRFDYLPSVSDFAGDYVVRTAAGLTVPLIAPVSARLSITDTYDSTPPAGTDENSLYLDTTLSLAW